MVVEVSSIRHDILHVEQVLHSIRELLVTRYVCLFCTGSTVSIVFFFFSDNYVCFLWCYSNTQYDVVAGCSLRHILYSWESAGVFYALNRSYSHKGFCNIINFLFEKDYFTKLSRLCKCWHFIMQNLKINPLLLVAILSKKF